MLGREKENNNTNNFNVRPNYTRFHIAIQNLKNAGSFSRQGGKKFSIFTPLPDEIS